MSAGYVHGYEPREVERLGDQAGTLAELLHGGTCYPAGSSVLEVGCGVGAQTVILATRSPGAHFISVDRSAASIDAARQRTRAGGITNVTFAEADVFSLPFGPESFDHLFVCFVLEHLDRPADALVALRRLLRPGGSATVIEGDHRSACFSPASESAQAAIDALVRLQEQAGGDALIGRRLYPLLLQAGFEDVAVSPRMVYVDASRPDLVDGFTEKTFTAMVEGVRSPAIAAGLIDAATFDAGVAALRRTTHADGVFCYTFFKGIGRKGP